MTLLQPLGARILVKRLPPPEQTRGGIYLLGREYPTIGRVVAIGEGRKPTTPFKRRPDHTRDTVLTSRIHLPEVNYNLLHVDDFINFHRDAIRQEFCLPNDLVMLSREHCLASYGANMDNFRPLGDRVLIKPLPEVTQIGSIHVPDQAVERPVYGTVIAVGMGHFANNGQYVPCDVKPGDKVLYGKFMGTEIKLNDEEHLLVREDDILGVER